MAKGLTVLLIACLLISCISNDYPATEERICSPEDFQFCFCANGSEGQQICAADGFSWSSCQRCYAVGDCRDCGELFDGDEDIEEQEPEPDFSFDDSPNGGDADGGVDGEEEVISAWARLCEEPNFGGRCREFTLESGCNFVGLLPPADGDEEMDFSSEESDADAQGWAASLEFRAADDLWLRFGDDACGEESTFGCCYRGAGDASTVQLSDLDEVDENACEGSIEAGLSQRINAITLTKNAHCESVAEP
ncbi:MAG: hypothetical protein C4523_06510 [Myxococcales bacterium]|nr:MAG: hypothetical protein C4523_06510 [Myxococcales bacterium]